ncbi:hypothetical protein ACJZ2D_013461 [Fusarium nematophilum]
MTPVATDGSKAASLDFAADFIQIIDGKPSKTKETRHGINPANQQRKAEVPVASQEDLDRAVDAAKKAFKTWSRVSYEERRHAVLAFADAIQQASTDFRDLLISEQGKPATSRSPKTLKRVTLELGGNDPAIIFPDVDVEKVAEKVAFFAFLNSGQICLNLKRIYIHESIYEQFRDAVVKNVKTYTLGDGSQEGISHGPLQTSMQYEKVKTFFDDIEKQGWKVATGGKIDASSGFFITPTVIGRPPDNSRIVVEEPFSPIVPLLSWKDEEEVIARANDSRMGLGASVWCNDLKKAEKVARELQAGNVWINTHFDPSPMAPFGGHKDSGIGTEWGLAGLRGLCNVQTLYFIW